ncbi:septum formation inhibitor Maf [Seonamhaeicola algicola]|uniref:Septum formation inhibitor Maf n=1 Tax=Seonamhaeicola algicola TaxID=1719036 RepID=A0A5C7B2I7_9FLAO|nr:septum formation inhibitor Maf [Seonamhaeicola algicola]TXE14941.1 septum formation inhibitor Maf [Seonamhaeicola algicola]
MKVFFQFVIICLCLNACNKQPKNKILANNITSEVEKEPQKLSDDFKNYWYKGEAEITSYALEQARYGEIRQGHAVLIYVTEDFLPKAQVKANNQNPNNIPVLKLNATKSFNTGIYPYTIMQSVFYPVSNNKHAIKVSSSMQEWCGHVYAQLNNRNDFEITSHSYFEGEADKNFTLEKAVLENELWVQLRINPKTLPTGNINSIPAFEYTRMRHIPIKAYKATATLKTNSYTISYPELQRQLTINFNSNFPFEILSWTETFKSGFGTNAQTLTTKATKLKTLKSDYWNKNQNKHEILRDTLFLN